MIFGRFINAELFKDLFVALKYLDSIPALLLLGHFVHAGFLDMRDRVLYRAL